MTWRYLLLNDGDTAILLEKRITNRYYTFLPGQTRRLATTLFTIEPKLELDFLLFSDRIAIMTGSAVKERVYAEIMDVKGEYEMDDQIGPCGGDVISTSAEAVTAEVFPGYGVCLLCELVCDARANL